MAWDAHPPTTNGARAVDQTVIAVAQLAISIGELEANRKAAAAAVTEAAAAGARLVVLPELCDSGYVFGDDAGQPRPRTTATPCVSGKPSPPNTSW